MAENKLDQITTGMMEHVCENLCRYPGQCESQEELEELCAECQMDKFVCEILNTYNELNDFEQTQCAELLKRLESFISCQECEYCAHEKATDIYWCRMCKGLEGRLEPGAGCTRGKRIIK